MWQLPLKLPPKVRQQNSSSDFERKTSTDIARTLSDMDENMSETFGVRCSRRVASRLFNNRAFFASGAAQSDLERESSTRDTDANAKGRPASLLIPCQCWDDRCQVDYNFDCNSMVPMGRDDQSARRFVLRHHLPGMLAAALWQ